MPKPKVDLKLSHAAAYETGERRYLFEVKPQRGGGATGTILHQPHRRRLVVEDIAPREETVSDYERAHKRLRGKVLRGSEVREAVRELGRRFPEADELIGARTTGVHGKTMGVQRFDLKKLRLRGKVGKVLGAAVAAYNIAGSMRKRED